MRMRLELEGRLVGIWAQLMRLGCIIAASFGSQSGNDCSQPRPQLLPLPLPHNFICAMRDQLTTLSSCAGCVWCALPLSEHTHWQCLSACVCVFICVCVFVIKGEA